MALIEREALLGRLRSHYNRVAGGGTIYTPSMMLAITDVECAPTIDPIRAAGGCRCGECKYWDDDGRCEPPENGLIREYTKPTDFCSYGEPREAQDDG